MKVLERVKGGTGINNNAKPLRDHLNEFPRVGLFPASEFAAVNADQPRDLIGFEPYGRRLAYP